MFQSMKVSVSTHCDFKLFNLGSPSAAPTAPLQQFFALNGN